MLDLDSLHNTIKSRYEEMENKQKLIESIQQSAEQHEKNGDMTAADQERKSAERYVADIETIKKNTGLLEIEYRTRSQKVLSLEGKIKDKKQQAEKEIENLEQELKKVA